MAPAMTSPVKHGTCHNLSWNVNALHHDDTMPNQQACNTFQNARIPYFRA